MAVLITITWLRTLYVCVSMFYLISINICKNGLSTKFLKDFLSDGVGTQWGAQLLSEAKGSCSPAEKATEAAQAEGEQEISESAGV